MVAELKIRLQESLKNPYVERLNTEWAKFEPDF